MRIIKAKTQATVVEMMYTSVCGVSKRRSQIGKKARKVRKMQRARKLVDVKIASNPDSIKSF